MGNEMGNNNTSDLKEEDYTNAIDTKNSLQEAADAENVKGENQIVSTPEDTDLHEKVRGLASDDPTGAKDPQIVNETPGGREQEENEVHSPTESQKAVMESTETSSENEIRPAPSQKDSEVHEKTVEAISEEILLPKSDLQCQKQASMNEGQEENQDHVPDESVKPANTIESNGEHIQIKPDSSSNDSEVHEKPIVSCLEEKLLGTNDQQLENHAPISEEKEGTDSTSNTKSTIHDPKPRQSLDLDFDQSGLVEVNANLSEEVSSESPQGKENFVGSSPKYSSEEHTHFLDPELPNHQSENPCVVKKVDDSFVNETPFQEEKMSNGEEEGFGLSNLTRTSDNPRSVENNCNGELNIKANSTPNDSLDSQLENVVLDEPLNSHQEVSEPEDKLMVLTEETKKIGSGSEIEEKPHEYNPTQSSEEPAKEPRTADANESQSEFKKVWSEDGGFEMSSLVDLSSNFGNAKDCESEEVKVAENGCKVDAFVGNQNKTSDGQGKDSEHELLVASEDEPFPIPAEFFVTDFRSGKEQQEEKKIVEEIEDKAEAFYSTVIDTEVSKPTTECVSHSLLIEQAESFPSESSASIIQSQNQNWATPLEPGTIPSTYEPLPELKRESCSEFFVLRSSSFNFRSSTAEQLVSASEKPAQDLPQYEEKTLETVTETTSSPSLSTLRGVKVAVSAFANGSTEAQESLESHSTESNPANTDIHVEMRKSPSFDLDLQIEARGKESDRTPLLFQDKTAMAVESPSSQAEVSRENSVVLHVGYHQDMSQYQSTPTEEKVITLERSDSEKSRTPFLGFLKEEEEAQIVVTPQKQENRGANKKATRELCNSSTEEAASVAPKGKEKRKTRPSFFGTCMCCAAVIN